MRNKTIIGTLILIIALVGTLLAFQMRVRAGSKSNEPVKSSCQEKIKDNKMIWEKLPHMFFSSR